jgi:hypothetical protein
MRWLYLHGFASGPDSTKGVRLAEHLHETYGIHLERLNLRVPSMERLRASAILDHVEAVMGAPSHVPTVLIGSSFGGWLSMRVAERNENIVGLVLLAPAIRLAARWKHTMPEAIDAWARSGWMEVDDHVEGCKTKIDYGFFEDLERIEARGQPDLFIPTLIVHGRRDDVVPIDGSRQCAETHTPVKMVEVDDGHQLSAALPTIREELDRFIQTHELLEP